MPLPVSYPVHLMQNRNEIPDDVMVIFQQQNKPVVVAAYSEIVKYMICLEQHTQPFNSPLYRTTWVSRYQKKPSPNQPMQKKKNDLHRQQAHTNTFNGPFSGTTRVSQYQKGKTNLDFTEARDSEWQWHQLGRMQVCITLQTDNHASTPPLVFYRLDALPAAPPTASKH